MTPRVLVLLILVLLAGLGLAWTVPDLAWKPPAPVAPDIPKVGEPAKPGQFSDGGQVKARPPFWESRRPESAPAVAAVADVPLRVLGVAWQGSSGVLILDVNGSVKRMPQGKNVDGMVFERIQDRDVIIRQGGRTRALPKPRLLAEDVRPATPAPSGEQPRAPANGAPEAAPARSPAAQPAAGRGDSARGARGNRGSRGSRSRGQ